MGKLGIFVNRQTLSNSKQLSALIKCRDAAEDMGHTADFIFPVEVKKIPKMDALFIRARTDPMNMSYVAAKMAELHGKPVIDDPRSIQICSDKVNMYRHLMNNDIPIPRTLFFNKRDLEPQNVKALFDELGTPLIIKEPSTSFSVRVEKVDDVDKFLTISKRFLKLSDWLVVEEFVESTFDWRVGVLGGRLLYACKYIIPHETFKIQTSINGHIVYCTVKGIPKDDVPKKVIDLGLRAAKAIGDGLYGVDIKESDKKICVIEVNDNPSLESGEDDFYPDVYHRVVDHLFDRKRIGRKPANEIPLTSHK
jgi:glutathione synthase/RimK-type ligase-like ATP-grasp enzyme